MPTGGMAAKAPVRSDDEIRNSVLIALRRGRISKADAEEFLVAMNELNVQLSGPPSYDELFKLAVHYDLTVYDAAYLELAMRESLPLASLDGQLNEAARKAGLPIYQP